jgi:hypothetical protein
MKKIMLISGGISAVLLIVGLLFKFMHLPGAMLFIFVGILTLSLVFLPLSFVLNVKEKNHKKDKVIVALGSLAAVSLSLGVLFKIMHWPFANILCLVSLLIMLLLFLPIYYLSGIKNPDTKVNTIYSSIVIIVGAALILTLIRSPQGTRNKYVETTSAYLRSEQILANEQRIVSLQKNAVSDDFKKASDEIYNLCSELKANLIKNETGTEKIDFDFDTKNTLISETYTGDIFSMPQAVELKQKITDYNAKITGDVQKIPVVHSILEKSNQQIGESLSNLIQIQMIVLQNQILKN